MFLMDFCTFDGHRARASVAGGWVPLSLCTRESKEKVRFRLKGDQSECDSDVCCSLAIGVKSKTSVLVTEQS